MRSQRLRVIVIGCLAFMLAAASANRTVAQSANPFRGLGGNQRPEPIGAEPYPLCREYEDQAVLEWDFIRTGDWVTSAEPYPEARRPGAIVTEIPQTEIDWQIALSRYRNRECASCATLLRDLLSRLLEDETTSPPQVARVYRLLSMALIAEQRLDEAIDVHRQAIEFLRPKGEDSAWQLTDHRVAITHAEQLKQLPSDERARATHFDQLFAQLSIPLRREEFEELQQIRNRLKQTCGPRSEAYREFLTLYLLYVPGIVDFNPPAEVSREIGRAAQELPAAALSLYGQDHPRYWHALLTTAQFYLMNSMQPASGESPLQQLTAAAGQWNDEDNVAPYELSAGRIFAALQMLTMNYRQRNDQRGLDRARLLVATFARTHYGLASWQYRNAWFEHRYRGGDAGEFYRQRAARLCNQGDALLAAAGQTDGALARYQKAVDEIEKEFRTNPHPMRLQILERMEETNIKLADEAELAGDYDAAVSRLTEASRLRVLRLGDAHWNVLELKRRIDQANKLSKLDKTQQRLAKDLRYTASSLRGVLPADAPRELFDVPGEVRFKSIEEMLASLAGVLGADAPLIVDARLALAIDHERQGSLDRSASIYEEMLESVRNEHGLLHATCADVLRRLAETHSMLGEMEAAERRQGEADAICARLGFRREALYGEAPPPKLVESKATEQRIQELHAAFRMCFERGRLVEALRHAQEMVNAVREIYGAEHLEYAIALTNLAAVQTQLGDYGSAKYTFHQLLQTFEAAGAKQTVEYASSLHNMAILLERLEQDEEALDLLNQEARLLASLNELRTVNYAQTLGATASLLLRLDRLPDAKQKLVEATTLMQQVGDEDNPVHIQTLHTLGFVALSLGAYEQSAELLNRVADYWRAEQGEWSDQYAEAVHDLGALHDAQNMTAEAQAKFHQSLAITRRNLKAASLVQSERQQIEMITALRRRLDSLLSLAIRRELDAAVVYQEVLIWKGSVLAGRRSELNLSEQETQELDRELMRGAGFRYRSPGPPGMREKESWVDELQGLLEAEEARRVELFEKHQSLIDTAIQRDLTVDQLMQSLPESAALVDYYQYRHVTWGPQGTGIRNAEPRLAAFLVTREKGVQLVELGPVGTIETWTQQWRGSIMQRRAAFDSAAARDLRRVVWEPIENLLGGEHELLIAPDGPLCVLPFAALPGRDGGKYLIEERPVTMIASPQLLAKREEPVPDANPLFVKSSLLIVGDVDYDEPAYQEMMDLRDPAMRPRRVAVSNWRRLPGTRKEMYAVRRVYEESVETGGCKLLPGRLASEEKLNWEVGHARWIHIATHGFYADDLRPTYVSTLPPAETENPTSLAATWNLASIHPSLLCGLVLASANRPAASPAADGLLTAKEVEGLRLQGTELVVLSACETGLGELRRGEGLMGLQRAFHSAGARNVIAALWKVDDDVSCELMERFYENLWQEEMSKAEALRQAQIAVLNRKEPLPPSDQRGATPAAPAANESDGRLSPFYWAAFTLSGDGS